MGDVTQWIKYSSSDLEAAGEMLLRGLYRQSAIHSNQSAEKMLKACYFLSLGEYKESMNTNTHDLVLLVKETRRNDNTFHNIMHPAYMLNTYYVPLKYPKEDGVQVNRELAQELLNYAWDIYNFCTEWLETYY